MQLNWHKDDREGRFLLRRMDEKTCVSESPAVEACREMGKSGRAIDPAFTLPPLCSAEHELFKRIPILALDRCLDVEITNC